MLQEKATYGFSSVPSGAISNNYLHIESIRAPEAIVKNGVPDRNSGKSSKSIGFLYRPATGGTHGFEAKSGIRYMIEGAVGPVVAARVV